MINLYGIALLVLAAIIVSATINCLLFFSRLVNWKSDRRRIPVATIAILVVTVILTGLQFVYPQVLDTLRRNPTALAAGEWWRMVTPLFVHSDGWLQILFNLIGIIVAAPFVERFYGSLYFLVLYFIPGLVGEITGYMWEPTGAGASVGLAGLVGSIFALALWKPAPFPPLTRILGAVGLLAALLLTLLSNHHGPPLLAGALLAALRLWRDAGLAATFDRQEAIPQARP